MLRASTAVGIRLMYPFFFFLVDEVRAGDASPGMSSGLISSRTLLSDPEDPGLSTIARLHGPGDSPGMSGEGRGVMSVIAARAGELMAEPGESEVLVAILAADRDDLKPGRVTGGGGAVTGVSSIAEASELAAWDGAPEVEGPGWRARPGLEGGGADTGKLVEGLRMWNLGMATSRGDVSRRVRAVFWFTSLVARGSSGGPGARRGSSR